MSRAQALMALVEEMDTSDLCPDCDVEDGEVVDLDPEDYEGMEEELHVYEEVVDEATGEVSEKIAKIIKISGGKVMKISKVICPPGFKSKDGKCVKMSSKEMMARKKAGKLMAKRMNTGAAKAKRAKSFAKRARMGL